MSELNNTIKPWLLANGFKEVNDLPKEVSYHTWDYVYTDNELYIYFDATDSEVFAASNNGDVHELYAEDAEEVVAYFKQHGKAPEQETAQADTPLARQMWDYLLSVGFEEIDSNDVRLGTQTNWKYTIAKGSLCAFCDYLTEGFIFLIDVTNNIDAATDDDLNIHSVADLQTWLQDNGYLDADNSTTKSGTELKQSIGNSECSAWNEAAPNGSSSITVDNIQQTIAYNITLRQLNNISYSFVHNGSIALFDDNHKTVCTIALNNELWLHYIECITGKLAPLPQNATVGYIKSHLPSKEWSKIQQLSQSIANCDSNPALPTALPMDKLSDATKLLMQLSDLLQD